MKSPLPFLLVAAVVLTEQLGIPHCATAAPTPIQAGRDYVRLSDWAKANGFQFRWVRHGQVFQLNSGTSKLTFSGDSREAQVNGVGVWLSFPALIRDGTPFLAKVDLQTTLQPLLAPARNSPGAVVKSICLDPGHGGKEPGNCVGPYQEKKYTLLLAKEVGRLLSNSGLRVSFTRSVDTTVELPERSEFAKRNRADLFVSVHFNSVESSRTVVRGAEVYCLTPAGANSTNSRGEPSNTSWCPGNRNNDKNIFLAYQVQKALTRSLSVEDRGARRARFAVLREAAMPAILVEAGFMSHPEEGKRIFDAAYRRQMARAIADGVLEYKRSLEQRGVETTKRQLHVTNAD